MGLTSHDEMSRVRVSPDIDQSEHRVSFLQIFSVIMLVAKQESRLHIWCVMSFRYAKLLGYGPVIEIQRRTTMELRSQRDLIHVIRRLNSLKRRLVWLLKDRRIHQKTMHRRKTLPF